MSRTLRSALALAAVFSLTCATAAAQRLFAVGMSGHQEVPSASTTGDGDGLFLLNATEDTLTVISGEINDLLAPIDTSIGVHIHMGYAGSNGGVVLPLAYEAIDDFNYFLKDTAYAIGGLGVDLVALMSSGQAYVNAHTLAWPTGEVRGQIVEFIDVDGDLYDAMLYGEQENPAVLSDGMGGVIVEVTTDSLFVSGSFRLDNPLTPVAGTGTHIHTGRYGQNGGLYLTLTPDMATDGLSGVFERSVNAFEKPSDFDSLMAGRDLYVNVHSTAHPAGEIRGQVVGYGSNVYASQFTSLEPTATPSTTAIQKVMTEKLLFEDSVLVTGSYSGWGPLLDIIDAVPFAQYFNAFTGSNEFIFPAADTRNPDGSGLIGPSGLTLSDDGLEALYDRTYSRHGWATSTGTILFTGRVSHECKRVFTGQMTGSQTVPHQASPALSTGTFEVEYYTNRIEVSGFLRSLTGPVDTDVAGGFHIHGAKAGSAGGILTGLNFFQFNPNMDGTSGAVSLPFNNIYSINDSIAAVMRDRGFYLNVHTGAYPSGEIRGQIVPRPYNLLHAPLAAGQAVPGGGPSPARGGVIFELTPGSLTASGSFNELAGGFNPAVAGGAHVHYGMAGMTGGIARPLFTLASDGDESGEFSALDNRFAIGEDGVDTLLSRGMYVNIHSQAVPSGELRGQIAPLASQVAHAKLSDIVTVPYTGTPGASGPMGHLHAEVYPSNRIVASGAVMNLGAPLDTSIAGGAHLHRGTVGETGGIAQGLEVPGFVAGDSMAVFPALDNLYDLDAATAGELIAGDLYVNVHTTAAPSGAARGQLLASTNQYPGASPGFRFPTDGMMVDLNSGDSTTAATIDWIGADDPDAEQDVAYVWQLYVDTTAAPVVQTMASDSSGVTFSFGQIDSLLATLGVGDGASATAYHRAWTTDGSLLTPGDFAAVTFTRFMNSGTAELPDGALRLVNTLTHADGELALDVTDLPAGRLDIELLSTSGRRLGAQVLDHAGAAQRYVLAGAPQQTGTYALVVRDAAGRAKSWLFVVK